MTFASSLGFCLLEKTTDKSLKYRHLCNTFHNCFPIPCVEDILLHLKVMMATFPDKPALGITG